MTVVDRSERFCVVGGGPSGLAVAKNFRQAGIPYDLVERLDDFGGNWYYGQPGSSVYRSTHLISSKRLTEFTDYPMPKEWPHFPSHELALEYLRSYARDFNLYEDAEFNTSVERIEPVVSSISVDSCLPGAHGGTDPTWLVTLSNGERRRYRGVVIANGHNWDPRFPNFPGRFDGLVLHSCQYKTPDVLAGKRVLVVGAGNSGCDIAVEAAQHAARTFHSMRRGYHYVPKFLRGKPIDEVGERLLRWRLPLWLRRFVTAKVVKLAVGAPQDFGLPKPDHQLFETHPIINSQMLYYAGHGELTPKPDVAELCGSQVRFVDGSREAIEVIVYATGFNITVPFIDKEQLNWRDGCPRLYLHVFHPRYDNLFVAGMIQPDSGQWGLVDYQAQLVARYVVSLSHDPTKAAWFRRLKASEAPDLGDGIAYLKSPRHRLEVEHFSYRRRLQKSIRQFGSIGHNGCATTAQGPTAKPNAPP